MSEPGFHLRRARSYLASSHHLLAGDFTEQAGRDAYLAAFHAAQAYITGQTGKRPKTHRGVRTEFARLARDEARICRDYTAFLANAYELKTIADYEPEMVLSSTEAADALQTATRLVDLIADLIPPTPS